MKRSITLFSAIACVIISLILAIKQSDPRPQEPSRTSVKHASDSARLRRPSDEQPIKRQYIDTSLVVKMTPADWEQLLSEERHRVSPQNQAEIIALAEELEAALASGGDPGGTDAEIYSEAMLTLFYETDLLDLAGEVQR